MTSTDMVTKFVIREDLYETPVGTFNYRAEAVTACERVDFLPDLNITHRVEMASVESLLDALNEYCGALAEEYNFSNPMLRWEDKGMLIPEKYWHLVAFAVEGSNEGYYVHVGAILRSAPPTSPGKAGTSAYVEFGLAKTYSSESAYEMAKQASRFLAAASWN